MHFNFYNILNFVKKDIFFKNNFFIKIKDRNFKITKNMLGLNVAVHNGKFFIPFKITENMLNKTIGSFSFSNNIILFNNNKQKFKVKKFKKKI